MGAFDDVAPITIPDPLDPAAAATFRKNWGWEEHEQVLVKGTVTVADQEYANNKYFISGKNGDMEMMAGAGRYAILDRMIMDWTLLRNGNRVPVIPANIKMLPANYSTPILERLDEMTRAMKEAEQEDFLDSANGHIEVSSELVKMLP